MNEIDFDFLIKNQENFDFLTEYTKEDYEKLRELFPEDGTESTKWQKFPKVPKLGKTIITFDGENPDCDIEFDEVILREGDDEVERTYFRHHYYWDKINFDIHYWMYAPEDPPGYYGYNVGD